MSYEHECVRMCCNKQAQGGLTTVCLNMTLCMSNYAFSEVHSCQTSFGPHNFCGVDVFNRSLHVLLVLTIIYHHVSPTVCLRGLIPIAILKHLETVCRLPTHQMFDYVCGTSTGSLIAGLLCVKKAPIKEVESMYHEMSTKVFKMNNLMGLSQLFLNHAFYDRDLLLKIIR